MSAVSNTIKCKNVVSARKAEGGAALSFGVICCYVLIDSHPFSHSLPYPPPTHTHTAGWRAGSGWCDSPGGPPGPAAGIVAQSCCLPPRAAQAGGDCAVRGGGRTGSSGERRAAQRCKSGGAAGGGQAVHAGALGCPLFFCCCWECGCMGVFWGGVSLAAECVHGYRRKSVVSRFASARALHTPVTRISMGCAYPGGGEGVARHGLRVQNTHT